MSLPNLIDAALRVHYTFEIESAAVQWTVHSVASSEAINSLGELHVGALLDGPPLTADELLGKNAHLRISSSSERSVRGVVREVAFYEELERTHARLTVVPAAWLLTQRIGSRIHQDKTVPEIVEAIVRDRLGSRRRSVRTNSLSRTYPRHEYIVQYQESEWDFITRLLASEGIVAYFDHESEDGEVLVLADDNASFPSATQGAPVPYWGDPAQVPTGESITRFAHYERVGTTGVEVAEYDWTRPEQRVGAARPASSSIEPPLEVFDHTHSLLLHGYDAERGHFTADTAQDDARIRSEILLLHRNGWSMDGSVAGARPGHVIELTGHPDGAPNGRYVIVAVRAGGRAVPGHGGALDTSLTVVPIAQPVRPTRSPAKPIAAGPELATVVTNNGLEVEVDRHGRVLVSFHWDRRTAERPQTCWLRVAQSWAGEGFGFQVLPRKGMEVLVSFLGGDPDRPVITGCLYNGTHTNHYRPDQHPTRTVLRTDSSPNAAGFNELSFEDAAGSEEVFLHAQKNLREEVLHDHTTRVGHDQSDAVDNDQRVTVGNDQTIRVESRRSATVGTDVLSVRGSRTHRVGGTESVTTHGARTESYESGCNSSVPADQTYRLTAGKGGQMIIAQGEGDEYGYALMTDDGVRLQSMKEVQIGCGAPASAIFDHEGSVSIAANRSVRLQCGDRTYIELNDGVINIVVGGSSIQLTAQEIIAVASALIRQSAAVIELNP